MKNNTVITEELLIEAGFENITKDWEVEYYAENLDIPHYKCYRKWTNSVDDKNKCVKLDISNGLTNNDSLWHLHIDNNVCESIGTADIDKIWQFNMLMEVFGSNFRL